MQSSVLRTQIESVLSHRFPAALTPRSKPAPDTVPTGIAAVDALCGGIPRGALTELCGAASTGRTSVLLSLLAGFTARECCALIDACDAFHPESAAAAGVTLNRLLWVRCGAAVSVAAADQPPLDSPLHAARAQARSLAAVVRTRTHLCGSRSVHVGPPLQDVNAEGNYYYDESGTRAVPGSGFGHAVPDPGWLPVNRQSVPAEQVSDGRTKRFATRASLQPRVPSVSRRGGAPAARVSDFKRLEQALKATDLLLQSGGFGLIAVDLGDIRPEAARRVPLTSWFRFRRAIEDTSTALVVLEQQPYARTCASLVLDLERDAHAWADAAPAHANLLRNFSVHAEVLRSDIGGGGRKPPRSASFPVEQRHLG